MGMLKKLIQKKPPACDNGSLAVCAQELAEEPPNEV